MVSYPTETNDIVIKGIQILHMWVKNETGVEQQYYSKATKKKGEE